MLTTAIRKQSRFLADMTLYLGICLIIIVIMALVGLTLIGVGTSQQSTTLANLKASGMMRSETQKLLAESMNVAYADSSQAMSDLQTDLADWTARHDAIKTGNPTLHVSASSYYPDIVGIVNASEPSYLDMRSALVDVLATTRTASLKQDMVRINKDAIIVYNSYDSYNTYLRNLTTTYQTDIWYCGVFSTSVILITLAVSTGSIFRPTLARLRFNVDEIDKANTALVEEKLKLQRVISEIEHEDSRLPVKRLLNNKYRVQGANNTSYTVEEKNGWFFCECLIYQNSTNKSCWHAKLARIAKKDAS